MKKQEKSNMTLLNQSKLLHIAVSQSVQKNVLESQSQPEVSTLSQSQLQTERSQLVLMKSWLFVRPPSPHQLQKYLQDQLLALKKKEEKRNNEKSKEEQKEVKQDED